MRILLISMVFLAPILAAPRLDKRTETEADLKKIEDNERKLIKGLGDLRGILGEDGYSKYEKADYTGAVESGSRHNGETVNETIKKLANMFYENMKPFYASKPGTWMEACLKEFKESGWPRNDGKTVSPSPGCHQFYTPVILEFIAISIRDAHEVAVYFTPRSTH